MTRPSNITTTTAHLQLNYSSNNHRFNNHRFNTHRFDHYVKSNGPFFFLTHREFC